MQPPAAPGTAAHGAGGQTAPLPQEPTWQLGFNLRTSSSFSLLINLRSPSARAGMGAPHGSRAGGAALHEGMLSGCRGQCGLRGVGTVATAPVATPNQCPGGSQLGLRQAGAGLSLAQTHHTVKDDPKREGGTADSKGGERQRPAPSSSLPAS